MADDEDETPENELDPSKPPADEPDSSRAWLALIKHAEKEFQTYQDKCDNIDKLYASLEKLSNTTRDRQFQMFWANIQVVAPSVYSRPPVPVVTPQFRDNSKPIPRVAAELLERATIVGFRSELIDQVMREVRDDMVVTARGTVWIRYESADKDNGFTQRVCIEHADRKDFLHDPARKWKEVDWVAKRSWGTRKKWKKRFGKDSGYNKLSYEKRKGDDEKGADDGQLKAGVWEVWSKSLNKVVWVGEGADKCLDSGEPHLSLEGFFPTPKPAYGTVQRRSLVPVPDMVFYKDQLEEINELTARISALSEAVKVRAFYPAGAGEIGDAIEAAIKAVDNNAMLVPISNWGLIGSGTIKDMLIWLPIDMIVVAIEKLIEVRKQLIDDVYQITGLSDIMRGSTVASETLGAQQLKSQYGSIRIKDRQDELIRFARDITRISAEIMAENFQAKTLLAMTQMEIPAKADLVKQAKPLQEQVAQITAQIQKAQSDPQTMQAAKENPEHAQQILGQAQSQIQGLNGQLQKLQQTVTIEQVMGLLKDQRIRPFVLDIETDSTIAPDENAQKQRATELITAVGGYMNQVIPLVQAMPQAAPVAAEFLKFISNQYRAGREMQSKIEEFADQMAQVAAQPKPPNPEQQKVEQETQALQQRTQAEGEKHQQQMQAHAMTTKIARDTADADQHRKDLAHQAAMHAMDEDEARKQAVQAATLAAQAQEHAEKMQGLVLANEKLRLEVERIKAEAMKPEDTAEPDKGPAESINFKDLPAEGQAQMAAQAGITLSPETLQQHADDQAQQQADLKAAAKPKVKEPA